MQGIPLKWILNSWLFGWLAPEALLPLTLAKKHSNIKLIQLFAVEESFSNELTTDKKTHVEHQ